MAMVTWLLFSCGWSRIGQWRMTVFCFFTSGWEETASVWWLPSGQCWASVTASPRCDRDVRSSFRSLSSGHLWRDVLVIGGDHCFEAWSSLGSQRTLGEQTMLWRWPPPSPLWRQMGPLKPSIIRLASQTFGPGMSPCNKQQTPKLLLCFAGAAQRIAVHLVAYFRSEGALLWLPACLGQVCHQCFCALMPPSRMMAASAA